MTAIDDQGRPEPPVDGDEAATLLGFLDYQRATLMWKVADLAPEGWNATTAATTMTLGGLVKHLVYVEDLWFSRFLHGRDPAPPWDTVDWEADRDWEWNTARDDSPEELIALWDEAVARSRAAVDEALATGDLGQVSVRRWDDGRGPSLRWILVHMIEEYARHNGHADLLREAADGRHSGE